MEFPDDLLAPGEVVAYRFRPHPTILINALAWAVVGTAALMYVMAQLRTVPPSEGILTAWAVWFLFAANVIRTMLIWRFTYYALTTTRIMWRTGMISRNTIEIPLSKIDHINVGEGLLARMFKYGDMTLSSTSIKGKIVWRAVPEVSTVRTVLARLRQEDQERRTIA
ncbi:PH domain-containing protein [Stackebrandtia soli]|uniref:PH domain-containing protein n=1 Tax=Stackebrandtia soli TaxID=1892856 RepID=UPI0039E93737